MGPAGVAGAAGTKGEDARVIVVSDILFDFDKADVRPEEQAKIDQIATYLKENETLAIKLDGHADPRGTGRYNHALSNRRLDAIRTALVNAGVPAERIGTAPFGDRVPKCAEKTEDCFQRDRRVEVFFGGIESIPAASVRGPSGGGRR
ncbi:MAG: OmpA family protein [Candidatus Rokuibacteriota bacterium]